MVGGITEMLFEPPDTTFNSLLTKPRLATFSENSALLSPEPVVLESRSSGPT